MRRLFFICLTLAFMLLLVQHGFAAEKEAAKNTLQENAASFANDLKKARDLILEGSGGNPIGRGFMVALFEPVFLAAMFCLGLWAGQMNERFKNVWAMPVVVFAATVIGAFITTYHAEWKPELTRERLGPLADLTSMNAITAVIGVLVGGAVGMGYIVAPVVALAGAAIIGLALGFSQTTDLGEHANAPLPFWTGFGFTGLLINIFGIGFETFMVSINLGMVIRWLGLATVGLAAALGFKLI